jgi:hypothetical protein
MSWKATGQASVRQQRGKWVVRLDGIDTETGKHRPRQLGTYPSQRTATAAAKEAIADGRRGSARSRVGSVVTCWAASRSNVSAKARLQYEWAAGHIAQGLGSIRLDRLDRDDVSRWLEHPRRGRGVLEALDRDLPDGAAGRTGRRRRGGTAAPVAGGSGTDALDERSRSTRGATKADLRGRVDTRSMPSVLVSAASLDRA